MFTGIVRGLGSIVALEQLGSVIRFGVRLPSHMLGGLEQGASVSISGVCLTVVAIQGDVVWFEAIPETLQRTTLGQMHPGWQVNLERAAKMGDEIGGHLLSGHIYGTAPIVDITNNIFTIRCPGEWMRYFFSKGYIALDGVSLTLVSVDKKAALFTVHLIPETLKQTTLGSKHVGDLLNIELDSMTQVAVETVENILRNQK